MMMMKTYYRYNDHWKRWTVCGNMAKYGHKFYWRTPSTISETNVATCEVPRTRTSLGDRSFTVTGPRLRHTDTTK